MNVSRNPRRKESKSAPSLLTKSCHDVDFLLWLLCSPVSPSCPETPHLPARATSSGGLHLYRLANKPSGTDTATNLLSCPIETTCQYSAKSLYLYQHLRAGNSGRPVNTIVPDIEDVVRTHGLPSAARRLLDFLREDYDDRTPESQIGRGPCYERCVWESDNDVCDDQMVTIEWEDDPLTISQDKTNGISRNLPSLQPSNQDGRVFCSILTMQRSLISTWWLSPTPSVSDMDAY